MRSGSEANQRATLAGKAGRELAVFQHVLVRHLDDDVELLLAVVSEVDEPHTTGAERGHDLVRAQAGTWRDRHV